jgi:hypothetical protein
MNHVQKIDTKREKKEYLKKMKIDYWFPDEITYPEKTEVR